MINKTTIAHLVENHDSFHEFPGSAATFADVASDHSVGWRDRAKVVPTALFILLDVSDADGAKYKQKSVSLHKEMFYT